MGAEQTEMPGVASPHMHLWQYWRTSLLSSTRRAFMYRNCGGGGGADEAVYAYDFAVWLWKDNQLSNGAFAQFTRVLSAIERIGMRTLDEHPHCCRQRCCGKLSRVPRLAIPQVWENLWLTEPYCPTEPDSALHQRLPCSEVARAEADLKQGAFEMLPAAEEFADLHVTTAAASDQLPVPITGRCRAKYLESEHVVAGGDLDRQLVGQAIPDGIKAV